MGGHRQTTPEKLSWWKRQVLSFLLRQWRTAHRKQAIAAARLTTYASQFGQLDWAIKCVQSDSDVWWMKDHNGLSSPLNHRKSAAPAAPAAPFANAPTQPPLSDAMPASYEAKHSNHPRP